MWKWKFHADVFRHIWCSVLLCSLWYAYNVKWFHWFSHCVIIISEVCVDDFQNSCKVASEGSRKVETWGNTVIISGYGKLVIVVISVFWIIQFVLQWTSWIWKTTGYGIMLRLAYPWRKLFCCSVVNEQEWHFNLNIDTGL